MGDCGCHFEARENGRQRGVLRALLAINAVLFVLEGAAGWFAQSTGLLADAADMLADALVYGIALGAVGGDETAKRRAARWSGHLQWMIAALILLDVIRRALTGSEPEPPWMLAVGVVALAGNLWCLRLISAHRNGEAHMRASWIFSRNDVIANLGVLTAGALVWWTGSRWPDLLIGAAIALVVLRGALHILRDTRERSAPAAGGDRGSS